MRVRLFHLGRDYYKPHPLLHWAWFGWRRGLLVQVWSVQADLFWGRAPNERV